MASTRCLGCPVDLTSADNALPEGVCFCPQCAGVWTAINSLEPLLSSPSSLLGSTLPATPESRSDDYPRKCPHCQQGLLTKEFEDDSGVELDVCPNGHGIWFDTFELEEVIDYRRSGHPFDEETVGLRDSATLMRAVQERAISVEWTEMTRRFRSFKVPSPFGPLIFSRNAVRLRLDFGSSVQLAKGFKSGVLTYKNIVPGDNSDVIEVTLTLQAREEWRFFTQYTSYDSPGESRSIPGVIKENCMQLCQGLGLSLDFQVPW